MAIYENEEVAAFNVDREIVCYDCLTDAERGLLTEDSIMTEK